MSLPHLLSNKLFSRQVTLPAPRDEALEAALLMVDPTHTVLFTCNKFQAVQQKKRSTPPPLPLDARSASKAGAPHLLRPGWRLWLSAWWHDAGIVLRSRLDAACRVMATIWAVVYAKVKEGICRLRQVDLRAQRRSLCKHAEKVLDAAMTWTRLKRDDLRIRYGRRFSRIARDNTRSP